MIIGDYAPLTPIPFFLYIYSEKLRKVLVAEAYGVCYAKYLRPPDCGPRLPDVTPLFPASLSDLAVLHSGAGQNPSESLALYEGAGFWYLTLSHS